MARKNPFNNMESMKFTYVFQILDAGSAANRTRFSYKRKKKKEKKKKGGKPHLTTQENWKNHYQ